MALNFPVDNMLGFNDRFAPAYSSNPYFYQDDPTYAGMPAGSREQALRNLAIMFAAGQPPTQRASQQPSIPIQSLQGSPPQQVTDPTAARMQNQPNSPATIGGSPNMALTNGGGYPMGGLPNQSPTQDLYSFNQLHTAPSMPTISGPQDLQRMQRHQQNLQNFRQLLARLGGYSFQG